MRFKQEIYKDNRDTCQKLIINRERHTDVQESLNTLLVKYYNDLHDRQSSGQDKDEVAYFYVGFFCTYLGTMFAEKIFAEISGNNI